jgi:hypothetical protein
VVTIPDYQTVMLPLLNLAADGQEHRLRDTIEQLADHFDLTEDERKELLPSGSQATFNNRVGWDHLLPLCQMRLHVGGEHPLICETLVSHARGGTSWVGC